MSVMHVYSPFSSRGWRYLEFDLFKIISNARFAYADTTVVGPWKPGLCPFSSKTKLVGFLGFGMGLAWVWHGSGMNTVDLSKFSREEPSLI